MRNDVLIAARLIGKLYIFGGDDMLYFPVVLVPELDLREAREALPKLQAILSFLSAGFSMVTKELEQLERYYPYSQDGKRYKWEVRKQLEKIETLIK